MGLEGGLTALLAALDIDSPILTRQEVANRMDKLSKRAAKRYGIPKDGKKERKPLLNRDEKWQKKWMPSSHFVLMSVPTDKIEQPQPAKNKVALKSKMKKFDDEPIFIDKNVSSHYRNTSNTGGQKLSTLVLDGKHRHASAVMTGRKKMKAWVGVQAISHFTNPDAKGFTWVKKS